VGEEGAQTAHTMLQGRRDPRHLQGARRQTVGLLHLKKVFCHKNSCLDFDNSIIKLEDLDEFYLSGNTLFLSFQARYRQYFEEDPSVCRGGDNSIPMEVQVHMQEVLSDGMAFCSVM
jgi:hypothetical protein